MQNRLSTAVLGVMCVCDQPVAGRGNGDREGDPGVLQWAVGVLQDSPVYSVCRGVSDDGDREGAEVQDEGDGFRRNAEEGQVKRGLPTDSYVV